MFAENLKQATSFTLHRAFPSNGNHSGSPEPANEQAPPPADKEAELETLHTTRDDILRLQQISKDVVPTKNNRKRGKETVGELFMSVAVTLHMLKSSVCSSKHYLSLQLRVYTHANNQQSLKLGHVIV